MCRLSTCCCCCSLETGGYIIGWFNIIGSGIAVIGCITWIILLSIGAVHLDDVKLDGVDTGAIIGGFIAVIVALSVFLVYFIILLMAAVMLVQGIRKRDHSRMMLFMIIMAIGVILQFIQVLFGGWAVLVSGTIAALISLYFFSVIYSLYHNIKDGNMGRPYV